ncbi:uncharacterized protein LOC108137466 [Drosophila elegans]|uniref:uncharacterized protein LOC108137466 n=1 Tax=Drosophila elegans TaxID=30023 RepID=UPI0007E64212|nr:uncharacterized protein LOC108137466 [Drosophila elegans]
MGNTASSSQVVRRPSHYRTEEEIFHRNHRNQERRRSRHCFVIRSQRPPKGVQDSRCGYLPPSSPTSCCCPPLPAVVPTPKPRTRCCGSSPPDRVRQYKTQGFPGNGSRQTARRIRVCHTESYPVPEPLGLEPEPQTEMQHSDCVQALHEIRQEPRDPYYPNPPRNTRWQEPDPLVHFDINRFDRDATHRAAGGPGGRRKKVSVRTCVDYDYDPEYPPREWPQVAPQIQTFGYQPQQSPHTYPPQRSRPDLPSWPPSYQRGPLPGSYENAEFEFFNCPYRR